MTVNPYQSPQADIAPANPRSTALQALIYGLMIYMPAAIVGCMGWKYGESQEYGTLSLLFAITGLMFAMQIAVARRIVVLPATIGLVANAVLFIAYTGRLPGVLLGYVVLVIVSTPGALLFGCIRLAWVRTKPIVLRMVFLVPAAFFVGWYLSFIYHDWPR